MKNVKFNFDMINNKVARLEMTDNDKPRFSIPTDVLKRPKNDL